MATGNEYRQFILDQLADVPGIRLRPMMGEYILYDQGKIAAYVCDNRLLVKPVPAAERLLPGAPYEPPYEGAKPMILVEQVEDRAFLKELFCAMYEELPAPKKKR